MKSRPYRSRWGVGVMLAAGGYVIYIYITYYIFCSCIITLHVLK